MSNSIVEGLKKIGELKHMFAHDVYDLYEVPDKSVIKDIPLEKGDVIYLSQNDQGRDLNIDFYIKVNADKKIIYFEDRTMELSFDEYGVGLTSLTLNSVVVC